MIRDRLVFEEFEPRILYSADLAPLVLAGLAEHQLDAQAASATEPAPHEIAFVDLSLPDAQALIDDLNAQARAGRPIEVLTIAAGEDGIARIGALLAERHDVSAVHLLSHGNDGVVQLGCSRLDAATLQNRAGELAGWGRALTADADLLIYGCNVAARPDGQALIGGIAALTGADVAASDDLTGAARLGGDWVLEQQTGRIETQVATSVAIQQTWGGALLTSTNELPVNATTNNDQDTSAEDRGSQQAVALDAAGNYVVVWTSQNQDGNGLGVYARRFDSNGNAITGEILVNTTTNDDQRSARVVSDAAGNFVVTWTSLNQDGTTQSVYARRFSGSGVALTAEARVNTTSTGSQSDSVIAMNASNGDYVISWQGEGPGDAAGIFFRRFNADGSAKDATDRLANTTDGGSENDPTVAMDPTGKFVIFWEQGKHIYFQRYDATGASLASRVQVDNALSTSSGPAVACDAAGNFTVVYREENLLTGVWGKGFNVDGSVKYAWFQAATGNATSPSIDMASDGSFVLVYEGSGDGDGLGVFARKYTATGSAAGSAFQINQTSVAEQSNASVSVANSNNYVVVWSGASAADSIGVIARQLSASNAAPSITSNGSGNFASTSLAENSAAVTTVTATDTDAATTLSYSITGGADAASFTIGASSGALGFLVAPNYETPSDAGADNIYNVTVQVSDGSLIDTQAIAITVTNVNEAPVAVNDAYDANQDQVLTVPVATGLLANDSDPEGTTLTVIAQTAPSHGTLSLVPAMLGTFTNLSNNAATDTRGDWSPGSSKIAFDSNRDGNNEIYVMNADGSGVTRLTNNTGDDSQAAWSPDGSKIAFMSNRSGSYEVWVMNSDGTGQTQLTVTGAATSGQPAWSPDGSTIAFTSNRSGGSYDIYLTSASGSGLTRLTTASGDDAEPVWSPDGTKLVFSSTRDGNSEIYVMNADGSGQTRLTTSTALDRSPVWSPYGSKIAFISDRSGTSQILIMDANGANPTAVTAEAAGVSFVDWSSGGRALLFTRANEIQSALLPMPGAFIYTPTAGYVGSDSFSYTVMDASGLSSTASVAITVNSVTAPVIGSNGGGATAAISVAENSTAVTTVVATDADLPAQTLIYAIGGGADAARFTINAATGALSFVVAPDFEAPTDAGANNVYDVIVSASDGSLTDTQAIAVTVTNLGEGLQTTVEQRVNTTIGSAQATVQEDRGSAGAVAMSSTGDHVVVWSSQNQDSSGWGVYAQRFDKTGAAVGAEFQVNQTTADDQFWASVAMDDAGRFVISWTGSNQDGTPQSIYARTYAADGSASSAEFRVNTTATGSQHNGSVAMDAVGNFIVVWQGNGLGDTDGIFGRRFNVTGTAIDATEFRVNTDLARGHYDATVSMNASGAFAVAWDNNQGAQSRRYDSSGTALGGEVLVAAGVTAGDAAVALANDGSMVVVWRETAGDRNVYLRRYDSTGAALGSAQLVNTTSAGDQISPSIAMDAAGNFIVAWDGPGSGDSSGVFARRYDASGTALGSEFLINTTTSGAQTQVSLAMQGPNDYAAVWTGEGPGDTLGVFSRQYGTINVAPVITSDGGGATAALSVAENGTAVTTVTATDLDTAQTLSYAITGGADAARFTINSSTGVLRFVAAPDFETRLDAGANNVYDLIVRVSDGALTDLQAIAVTVTNVNEAPVIGSNGGAATASLAIAENQVAVTTVAASDVDAATTLVYSISGGADAAKFSIDAATGMLSFVLAPNFEAPGDAGANNVFDVIVSASDGTLADTQAIAVTVTNVNEAPSITSNGAAATAAIGVAENQTVVTTVSASDVDAATSLVYSIFGGADASKFSIDAATGALSFVTAPNFEAPGDAGANNVYDVIVRVSDGALSDTQAIAVTVGNVNEAPVITSLGGGASATLGVAENGSAVGTVLATDPDAASTLNYSISGGADAALFSINVTTGALAFVAAPNFEALGDAGANNVYDVIVRVSDGALADTQAIAVTVTNVNEAPVITSGGGAASAALGAAENQTAVSTVTASDADAATTLSYTIAGGADAAKFSIDAATGVLRFIAAPDFEAPGDAGTNNVYDVIVQVSDGALNDAQAIAVTVGNVNEAPVITSLGGGATASVGMAEGLLAVGSVTATDVDAGASLVYSIAGGADAAKFSIDAATGALVFVSAPNFDIPTDAGANNVYDLIVRVSDGALTDTQAQAVTVTNVNVAPVITSLGGAATAALTVAENQTSVGTVTATDGDLGTSLSYSIAGGADAARFSIDAATGVLRFIAAPDFETPLDAGANNVYNLIVQVSDGALVDTQALAVTVGNVDESPTITANSLAVAEGGSATPILSASDVDTAAAQLVYAVSGLSGGQFELTSAAGVAISSFSQADVDAGRLRFVHDGGQAAPAYLLALSDGNSSTAPQAASVAFTPVNDVPLAAPVDLGSIAEDGTRLITTAELLEGASDADGDALSVSGLSLASGRGSLLDHGNGTWTYTPAADWSGSVQLSYTLGDGTAAVATGAQLIVTAVNDAPRITSLGGAASATLAIEENSSSVGTVTASDIDGPAALHYSIGGGADAGAFRIDAVSGALSFIVAPDRERPGDANGDNRYDVIVRVSDGGLAAEQRLAIDVANVDEAPTLVTNQIVLHGAASGGGNTLLLIATDPDTPTTALVYQASGETGGRFERSDAVGVPITRFTQADVDAGVVRFVQDGSGTTPGYLLQLSDGVSTSTAAAPTVRVDAAVAPVATDEENSALASLPAPAAAVTAPAQAAPAAAPDAAVAATAPTAPVARAPGVPAAAAETPPVDAPAASADALLQRNAKTFGIDLRGPARGAATVIEPVLSPLELSMAGEGSATGVPGGDSAGELPGLDLASALRERNLALALEPLRRESEAARGVDQEIVVGSTAVSAGLSVGYVLWLARGGVLMASVMSALPAWASLDPLPVLGQVKGKAAGRPGLGGTAADEDDDADQDAVEQLFSKAPAAVPQAAARVGGPGVPAAPRMHGGPL